MSLTLLDACYSRPAEPGFAAGWRRRLRDAALAALGRAALHCPARRSLASLAYDPRGA